MVQTVSPLCTLECVLALRPSSFPRTSRLLASWWVLEQASPPLGASGSRDSMIENTKVGCQYGVGGVSANSPPQPLTPQPQLPLNLPSLKPIVALNCLRHAGVELCPMILVFGCRQSEMDHIYKEETIQAKNKGVFKELYTVYSREPGKPKVACQGSTQNPSLPPADGLDELIMHHVVIQYPHCLIMVI